MKQITLAAIFLISLFLNRCAARGRPSQSKEKHLICTPSMLFAEGAARFRTGHLMGHWAIRRACMAISFDDYMDDQSVPVSIRKMSPREMLQSLDTALDLSSVNVNNLRILRLGRCGLGNEHVEPLLKLLKMKPVSSTLQELHLNGNHLTDKGLKMLLEGIRASGKFRFLKALHLERNNIGHEGMKTLVTHVTTEVLSHYEDLYLADNPAWSKGSEQLEEVLKWLPISQNENRVRHLKGTVRVHVGGPGVIRGIVTAGEELAARSWNNANNNRDRRRGSARATPREEEQKTPSFPSGTRAVAMSELALLQRRLSGMRCVLPWSHPLFTEIKDNITHSATQSSSIETGEWERESVEIMRLFVEDCLGGGSQKLQEISSGAHHDTTAFATHLAALGHRTPSSLIYLSPEDLQDHLQGSPDILSKVLLRCSCDYYVEFQHLASVYVRANTPHQVTLGDLVDNRELMAFNQKMGPLFDRNPQSVKGAGSRVTNMGTGQPHQSWLPYRHKDHHLPNKEASLHQRSTQNEHNKRAQRTLSKALDFAGTAGLYSSYAHKYQGDQWQRDDVLWQRSFCSASYFRKPHGGEAQKLKDEAGKRRRQRRRGSVSGEL